MVNIYELEIAKEDINNKLEEYKTQKYPFVIKSGGECLNDNMLSDSLKVLSDNKLNPIFTHGAGTSIDSAIMEHLKKTTNLTVEEIEKKIIDSKKDGMRITELSDMPIIYSVLDNENKTLLGRLNSNEKVIAEGIHGIFIVEGQDPILKYAGSGIVGINEKEINAVLEKSKIPIISSLGRSSNEQIYNPNADSGFAFLAIKYAPKVSVLITKEGGVYDESKKIIPKIKADEIDKLISSYVISGGMIPKLTYVKQIVSNDLNVIITNPKNLLYCLFSDITKASNEHKCTYVHK